MYPKSLYPQPLFPASLFPGPTAAFVALPLNPYATVAVEQAGDIELNPYATVTASVPASLE